MPRSQSTVFSKLTSYEEAFYPTGSLWNMKYAFIKKSLGAAQPDHELCM